MISSFGAILALSSDGDAATDGDADADDYDICKNDPYMSPSYTGDTKIETTRAKITQNTILGL